MRYVQLTCPEDGCDWYSSDWEVQWESDARDTYVSHWNRCHAPKPPNPDANFWSD